MSVLLQVKNVSKSYGARKLLDDVTVSFSRNQKIGVIGRNGEGKSTLCKIITGHEEMDSGQISKNSNLRLSYLEQHDPYKPDETISDFLMRYTGKEEWECGEVAAKFQIHDDLFYEKISALAGGYQTRVKLTAMLLRDPNFLILDEPSNYLDLSTLILLENFLINFNGGYLIVSHDREFLKKTCKHTLEVELGNVTLYPGNIESYFEYKQETLRHKEAYNRNVEKKKAQLQSFVDRFGAKASQATRAKSKEKQIAKLETIEILNPLSNVNIRIPNVENKGGAALICDNLDIGYPDKLVASDIGVAVDRGSHVAILGDNGQGKTTFMRTIAGSLPLKGGKFRWAGNLQLAYYAQHVFKTLHPEDDIFTHLRREAADGVTNQQVLDMAGSFLFKGIDVEKKVAILSGGERARLCLAGMLLSKSQVLLLDEPTNHLDFETVEALGVALKKFSGTVFFISHDRTFVNLLATHILDVKGGHIKRYPGTYEDYVYFLEKQAHSEYGIKLPDLKKKEKKQKAESDHAENSTENAQKNKKNLKAEITRLKIKINKIEVRIQNLSREKEGVLEEINNNPFNYSKDREERLKRVTASLVSEEALWLELQGKLEKLSRESDYQ